MIGTSILSVIVLLGILIFVHELGHFLLAKGAGVGVLKFSLGFGPRLIGKKWGETEYMLSLIPLGGYVKLLGESPGDSLTEEQERRSFLKQPVWKRMAIVIAGPVFNFLLAILIFMGVYMTGVPALTADLGNIQPESAAAAAGLRSGDRVIAIDERKIARWDEMAEEINGSEGRTLRVAVVREAKTVTLSVTPRVVKVKNLFGEEVEAYKIGVGPAGHTIVQRLNPFASLWASLQRTWAITHLTLISIVKMFEGIVSPKTLGGPILIAQLAGAQVKEGLVPFLLFIALLSINLGVLNLLPIPVLDGGHLLFFLIEVVIGREVNIRWREMAQQVGFVLLILLMIFVFIMDIERLNLKFIEDLPRFFTK